jgi:hypothetical protein
MLWAAGRLGSPLLVVCCWDPSGDEGLKAEMPPVVSFNKKTRRETTPLMRLVTDD